MLSILDTSQVIVALSADLLVNNRDVLLEAAQR
jgi:hypothetical protein